MKKTIVILLVLVIGMMGLFAGGTEGNPEGGSTTPKADTSLKLTTTIIEVLETKLVAGTLPETLPKTKQDFSDLTPYTTPHEATTSQVGILYVMTNISGGYTLTISGKKLAGSNVTTEIGYVLTAEGKDEDNQTVTAVLDTNELLDDSEGLCTSTPATVSAISAFSISPYVVTVNHNTTDYDAAQADVYLADVYFEFIANQ